LEDLAMMGPKQEAQAALFYEFSLEGHVPQDHLLRSIDRFVDLNDIRQYLTEFYSHTRDPTGCNRIDASLDLGFIDGPLEWLYGCSINYDME
jgi:hypothetical protein